jgi:hypothetical protein
MAERLDNKERKFWFYAALGLAALIGLDILLDDN